MPEFWSIRQLADHYGIASRTVYGAIQSGRLVAHRFAAGKGRGTLRVADRDRLAWEAQCRRETSGRPRQQPKLAVARPDLVWKYFGLQ